MKETRLFKTGTSGYEVRDIHYRSLMALTVLLLIILAVSGALTFGLNHYFRRTFSVGKTSVSPLAQLHRLPPEPRLQVSDAADLIRLREVEDSALNSYAWIDPAAGTVRLPIARAMDLLSERGLPSRPGPETAR